MGRAQRIRVGAGFWVVTRESRCKRAVRGWIPGNFLQKCPLCPLYPPPLITMRNETFFWVDGGWRRWHCLTDAQRYYTTLQIWQVTGSADGVYPGYLARFWPYLDSYAGRRRDSRDFEGFFAERVSLPTPIQRTFKPRGICNNLGCTPESVYANDLLVVDLSMSRLKFVSDAAWMPD